MSDDDVWYAIVVITISKVKPDALFISISLSHWTTQEFCDISSDMWVMFLYEPKLILIFNSEGIFEQLPFCIIAVPVDAVAILGTRGSFHLHGYWLIGPWEISIKSYKNNLQADFSDWWLWYLKQNCPPDEHHWTLVMISQQQAITWTNVDPDPCHHVASLGHNESTEIKAWLVITFIVKYEVK